jgi:predicted ATP-grasp superfamily ATP-dependent carboligase
MSVEVMFNLKMTCKQLERHSKKAEKDMEKSKTQVKKVRLAHFLPRSTLA